MKTQRDLVDDFRDGATHGRASNIFIEGDTLYSYGYHFPLALRYEKGKNLDFLVNADRYSVSTSAHQGHCFELGPQIPFSALRSAGIDPRRIDVIEATKDEWHRVSDPLPEDPDHYRETHSLGAIVLGHRDKLYLSGLDRNEPWHLGSYFLSELPHRATSVADAYESLIPPRVRQWRDNSDNSEVLRQGEWFFMPTDQRTAELSAPTYRNAPLLDTNHYVTEMRKNDKDVYVRGTVSHKPAYRRPQHRRLKLDKTWHIAEKNLAIGSWNASGYVD